MSEPIRIALYGTLRRGEAGYLSFGLSAKLRFVAGCRIRGQLVDLGAYPGLIDGDGVVVGELHEIDAAATLAELDALEEFDVTRQDESLFIRRSVTLLEPVGTAYAYFLNTARQRVDRSRIIPSGDWLDRPTPAGDEGQRSSA